jgi:hypothetical protein
MSHLTECPTCRGELTVTEYQCPVCRITIHGQFGLGGLGSLTREQEDFVRVFLCSEGNIREVERRLKISYPTVKNRLAEITRKLCEPTAAPVIATPVSTGGHHPVLDELAQGRISIDEALERLQRKGE